MKEMFANSVEPDTLESLLDSMRQRTEVIPLHNDAYRLHLPGPDVGPFANFGKPGYEAQTRELLRLSRELSDERDD
jgi:hypothetical protein